MPGRGEPQARGIPRPLIALTKKKTSAAKPRIVVMMAARLLSILKRLSSRLTKLPWRNLATINPSAIRLKKAMRPRTEIW